VQVKALEPGLLVLSRSLMLMLMLEQAVRVQEEMVLLLEFLKIEWDR
jgi:hypothetical protein